MTKVIKLKESDLYRIIKRVLNEGNNSKDVVSELEEIMKQEGAKLTKDSGGNKEWSIPNTKTIVQLCTGCGEPYIIDIRHPNVGGGKGGTRFSPPPEGWNPFTKEKFIKELNSYKTKK
jgi:hypothetical protein